MRRRVPDVGGAGRRAVRRGAARQEAVALFVPVLHANLQKKLQAPPHPARARRGRHARGRQDVRLDSRQEGVGVGGSGGAGALTAGEVGRQDERRRREIEERKQSREGRRAELRGLIGVWGWESGGAGGARRRWRRRRRRRRCRCCCGVVT